MITLPIGFTAVTWTGADTPIASLADVASISRVFTVNPVTNTGFWGYQRGGLYPTLSMLRTGVNYLVNASAPFTLMDAVGAPSAFASFPGYTAPGATTPATNPATGPGFVATAIAANNVIGGTLVARIADGVLPYDATNLAHRYLLFGVALNSALPGGMVSVQRGGYVTYPGLTLTPGMVLVAGANGQITTTTDGLAFSQVIGKAISADEFIYQVEDVTTLSPNT